MVAGGAAKTGGILPRELHFGHVIGDDQDDLECQTSRQRTYRAIVESTPAGRTSLAVPIGNPLPYKRQSVRRLPPKHGATWQLEGDIPHLFPAKLKFLSAVG